MIAGAPTPPLGEPTDVRPLVGYDSGNRPLWLGLSAIALLGAMLFWGLEARRQGATVPAVKPRVSELAPSREPPPLYIPPDPIGIVDLQQQRAAPSAPPATTPLVLQGTTPRTAQPTMVAAPPTSSPGTALPAQGAPPADTSPAIVLDATSGEVESAPAAEQPAGGVAALPRAVAARARAARMANRATIVPQGTLIAAVLETALDSTQPGQARAVVSANVVNLIGDRVLIPRGSRLFGTYQGELAAGQKRALVQWTRLVRPDGVTIAIDSPAADRLGRAGIKGRVNTHFPERLGGALLQSAIDIGSLVTGRAIYDSSVVVAVPGATQGAASSLVGQAPKPTLRVRQGTRISVFVARDLDFTSVEARR